MAKDEATEVIWPDVDLDGADLAFHRTLGGLRQTLEPGHRNREESTTVVFHNDRSRLDPRLVASSDRDAFEQLLHPPKRRRSGRRPAGAGAGSRPVPRRVPR